MSTVETLTRARDLIARPGGWTQNAAARDANGVPISPWVGAAVCFCALGATWIANGVRDRNTTDLEAYLTSAMGDWPADFNDEEGRTQAEVVAAFDRAIALAKADAP